MTNDIAVVDNNAFSALAETLTEAGVDADELTPAQRRILMHLWEPGANMKRWDDIAKDVGVSPRTCFAAFKNPAFQKVYQRIQVATMMAYIPEVDKTTFERATSPDGTDKDRDLFYRRAGVFDGKKGGLTINVVQNNPPQGGNDDQRRASGIDAFVSGGGDVGRSPRRVKSEVVPREDTDKS